MSNNNGNGNGHWWDVAKQVPALAVLTVLTYFFLQFQQQQTSAFTAYLDDSRINQMAATAVIAEQCHDVQRAGLTVMSEVKTALTHSAATNQEVVRILSLAITALERNTEVYNAPRK